MLPSTSDLIKKYHLDAKKSLGQNFILDKNFTDKIARAALEENKEDFSGEIILEIGSGPASLTRSILDLKPQKLIAVEKDKRCLKLLKEVQEFYGADKFEIFEGDALEFNEVELFKKHHKKIKIIANLPYNIGTFLVLKWLKNFDKISSLTLMLQKEVAQRIAAKKDSEHYGRLSLALENFAQSDILFLVNKSIFTPPPKVTSAIIQIVPREKPLFQINTAKFEKITQATFSKRRKMLRSALKDFDFIDDLSAQEVLERLKIDGELRPQNLDLRQFCDLAQFVK